MHSEKAPPQQPLASTPTPPYYAVVFSSVRTADDSDGYAVTAQRMMELAAEQPGFLGVESVRDENRVAITVSYWKSLDALHSWGRVMEHQVAQANGRSRWYQQFRLRICRVEHERTFDAASGLAPQLKEKTHESETDR